MTLEIYNGTSWVDITPYIAWQGVSFSRNDIDDPDTGRDMSGTMRRGRVAIKEKMNVQTIPLKRSVISTIYNLVLPQTFQVRVTGHPSVPGSSSITYTMYSNNFATSPIIETANGEVMSAKFPLIEV